MLHRIKQFVCLIGRQRGLFLAGKNNNWVTGCNNISIHNLRVQNSKAPEEGPCCFEGYAVQRNRVACMQLRATGQALPQK
ncbi:hypothetical protein KM92DES2_11731 [uncultured Desulfovibrio sp.]|uniref:Uncharacterized protein n=1 Tax=uncultured Desulfovibrio sp. TaxID=167968 RepID=A0A212JU29_9BACT|nr:hypothetical protein KM92DES2_11731 [uncultured Desulfovibrio sp.]